MTDRDGWVSETSRQVLVSFASRENATVEEVLSLARQIKPVMHALSAQTSEASAVALGVEDSARPVPAVAIEDSVKHDSVVCLCCGKSFTMLKRHLKAEHGLTEEQYRERFGLAEDHPLTAPSYSRRKADYAKQIGLGKYSRDDAPTGRPTASA